MYWAARMKHKAIDFTIDFTKITQEIQEAEDRKILHMMHIYAYMDRIPYWSNILGVSIKDIENIIYTTWTPIDEVIKEKYAELLKTPEVMARVLGGKE